MKPKRICVKCGNLATLNEHGVCKECEQYDKKKSTQIDDEYFYLISQDNS